MQLRNAGYEVYCPIFLFPLYFSVRLAWCAVVRICHREAALYVKTALEHLVWGLLTGFLLKY